MNKYKGYAFKSFNELQNNDIEREKPYLSKQLAIDQHRNLFNNLVWNQCVCNQLYRLRFAHQFWAQMLEAKVSWLLCIGRLVSKTDNVMHLLHMLGKTSK